MTGKHKILLELFLCVKIVLVSKITLLVKIQLGVLKLCGFTAAELSMNVLMKYYLNGVTVSWIQVMWSC